MERAERPVLHAAPIDCPGERTGAPGEDEAHHRAQDALRESEEKYRSLFAAMNQGYTLAELVRDGQGRAIDFRFLEINPAWERLVGMPATGVVGRTYNEVLPPADPDVVDFCSRAVESGQPARREYHAARLGRWYDVHVFPRGGQRFAVLYDDISVRKRQELNLSILAGLGEALTNVSSEAQMIAVTGERLATALGIALLYLVDIAGDTGTVAQAWHAPGVPAPPSTFRPADYENDAFFREVSAHRTVVVDDTQHSPHASAAAYARLHVHAYIKVPLYGDGGIVLLVAGAAHARQWREDEVDLVREVGQRVSLRLQRLRAEAALREVQQRQAFLLALADSLKPVSDPVELQETAARVLYEHLGVDRALYAEVVRRHGGEDRIVVRRDCRRPWMPAAAGEYRIADFTRASALRDGALALSRDIEADPDLSDLQRAAWRSLRVRAHVTVPLVKDARLVALMAVHQAAPRTWSAPELALLQETAERAWTAVERARAEAALRESEANQAFVIGLSDALRSLGDAALVRETACRMLGEHLRADRVVYADIEGEDYRVRCSWEPARAGKIPGVPVDEFGVALLPAWRRGGDVAVADIRADRRFSDTERARLEGHGIAAFVGFMVVKDGRRVGALAVQSRIARGWSRAERALTREVGDRLWSAARRAIAEAALRESEGRFRALADASPALIWQLDAQGHAIYLNQRYVDVTGQSREQLRDDGWVAVVHPDDLPDYVAEVGEALAARRPLQKRVRIRIRDGSWHWFESHAVPWFNDAGEYAGHVGISIDVNEAVRAEASLREADRRKDEFLATLAHELRNPLAPISNAVHLLRHPEGRRRADRIVEMVGRQVRQIVRLVDDLMEVSRITRGKIELERKPLLLADVVNAAVETSQPAIDQARHRLSVVLPAEPLMVDGDKVRLTQVFTNLINNAAKYTDRGGDIGVEVRRDGDWAVVTVRDNGVGIGPEQLPHVFEMFVQGQGGAGRGQGGLGIGLTMVRNLVDMHGGQVQAWSAGPGKGSEFTVRLPLLAPADDAPLVPQASGEAAPLAGKRILVVDDNRDAADSLCMLLGSMGAQVSTAYDGLAGIAALERGQLDAVLLDIGMPGMDGHEVARRIRGDPRFAGLCLIALTGWGQQADRELSRASGFDEHLTKPVDLDALEALLARCHGQRSDS
jgi:PAS domain S-box-containing protein